MPKELFSYVKEEQHSTVKFEFKTITSNFDPEYLVELIPTGFIGLAAVFFKLYVGPPEAKCKRAICKVIVPLSFYPTDGLRIKKEVREETGIVEFHIKDYNRKTEERTEKEWDKHPFFMWD